MKKDIVSELEDGREINTIDNSQQQRNTFGFFSYNLTGNFSFVDDNFAKIFGYTKEELLSMNFIELIHPEDLDKILQLYGAFLKTSRVPKLITSKFLRKDKTSILIEIHQEIIKKNNEITGIKGIVKEIISDKINFYELSEKHIKELTDKINQLDNGQKRTFTTLRNIILICLSKGQLSINEISHLSGINWKTVENHLTYLIGKKLIKENFSSKYVRLFELTERGKEYILNLQKQLFDYFIKKSNLEVTKL